MAKWRIPALGAVEAESMRRWWAVVDNRQNFQHSLSTTSMNIISLSWIQWELPEEISTTGLLANSKYGGEAEQSAKLSRRNKNRGVPHTEDSVHKRYRDRGGLGRTLMLYCCKSSTFHEVASY